MTTVPNSRIRPQPDADDGSREFNWLVAIMALAVTALGYCFVQNRLFGIGRQLHVQFLMTNRGSYLAAAMVVVALWAIIGRKLIKDGVNAALHRM